MRCGWYSNGPDTPTGYGVQTDIVTRRLAADGHEVHIFANYGHTIGVRSYHGCNVWPGGVVQYSLDVIDEQAKLANVDVVITLYDVWVLKQAFKDVRTLSWTPVDHFPATPEVLEWARRHETIAMSDFGARALRIGGVEPIATIPHAIEDVYRPTPTGIRSRMNIPDDAFLITINAANIGTTPVRKNWSGNLEAVAVFMAKHPDAYLYVHTDLARPGGMHIPVLIQALGMDRDRISAVPTVLYRSGLVTDEEMAAVYSTADVLLATSKGEGFGVPVIEAMGCGTPSIVSDFSAQPEIVGDTGWKVPGQLDWDHNQGAWFFTPFTTDIVGSLEAAYQQRGQRREACVQRAELYRADRVYAEHWRPLIASLEPKERKGMSNAARRRAKKEGKRAA